MIRGPVLIDETKISFTKSLGKLINFHLNQALFREVKR